MIVALPLRMGHLRWADLPLPAFLFDGHVGIDPPHVALTFLITLDERIVLAQIMAYTGLPTTCLGLEFVIGIGSLDVIVNLLKVHLTRRSRRDGLMDDNDVIGCRSCQLLFCVIFNTHLW